MNVYSDNAATSFPKPNCVYNDILNYMTNIGGNPGRGASTSSLKGNKVIFDCRHALCDLFNFQDTKNVIFTSNITTSLNMLIKGVVKPGWHVITSSMDHNSTLRTLNELSNKGLIELDIIECNEIGELNIDTFKSKIKGNTKLVCLSHGSNVVGTIQPLEAVGAICKENDIFFVIDTAQTAGVIELDFKKLNCNALAFTGHKSLLGPQGIGGFIIDDSMNEVCSPLIVGGTGSLSSDILQPIFLPDKFESGTINSPGIAGLLSGVSFLKNEGLSTIKEHEDYLTKKFIEGVLNIPSIKVYGNLTTDNRTSTISINSTLMDNSELGFILDSEYNIITRTGLHCAPLAHKTIGTFPMGTLRFSFGYFNDDKDVSYILSSINSIIKNIG
ncbi:MAG: aminotransferase class V-fold PLP-dependent enzyme [Terrisporobacter sp.]|uniref:aminotransferase class V-fold PLP-dependent enzyme n=1 Tax=Clostridium sp. TaxID=1506 RepID=UPI00303000B6